MALTRPTLLPVPAFDATQEYTFTFSVQGSTSQIVANRLTIRNQDTNDIVYDEKQETFRYEHTVNAGELTNNTYYNATISVFDAQDNESTDSIPIQFWCYTTPTIEFTNIPASGIVDNASFEFEFEYNQSENEPLNSYIVRLYNSSQVEISSSGLLYATNGTPPFIGTYTFTGFDNNTVYYVQVTGTTVENTIVSTELNQFTVQYTRPDIFTLMQLVNNCEEGYITVRSNIIIIEGVSNPDPPIFIDNKEVDLTDPDSWVEFNDGFSISDNMLARAWFRNPNEYSTLFTFSNISGQTITVNFMLGYEDINSNDLLAYLEVHVTSLSGLSYYIYSNFVSPLSDTQYYVMYLTRLNNIYQVQLLTIT